MIYIFNHGDSEAIMTRLLSSKTRAPIQSFPKKNVRKKKNRKSTNIQVNSLRIHLKKMTKCNEILDGDIIITIMDLDDCDKQTIGEYKNGSRKIFGPVKKEGIKILPIYNTPNLDLVLRNLGYDVPGKLKSKNSFYKEFFENWDLEKFKGLRDKCKNSELTNMDKLIDLLIDQSIPRI